MERQLKREVKIGNVTIGGTNPVAVQTMLNVPIRDVEGNVAQAKRVAALGCQILRASVPTLEDVRIVEAIKNAVDIPFVADIHFDYRIALACVEAGADKIRINPGNIGSDENVRAVARACNAKNIPIRIGVNAGSLEKDILAREGGVTARGMADSALRHVKLLEDAHFTDIVLSLKASSVPLTVEAYRLMDRLCDYPLHLGVTEAGLPGRGTVKSAIGIGALLLDGIGDTVRVSLTGDPEEEPRAALEILRAVGLRGGVRFVSCPTCGRTQIDVAGIARRLEAEFADVDKPVTVAVMGCVVNGPGEARGADVALCGGKNCGELFIKGKPAGKLTGDLAQAMANAVREYLHDL